MSGLISTGGERGLLGLAFHPDYATNRRFYVSYTDADGALVVARFVTQATDRYAADPASRRTIIRVPHPTNANHNGGMITFRQQDADGGRALLYIGTGDGGGSGDPGENAQDRAELLGKLLRIDVGYTAEYTSPNYRIPSDNPYAGYSSYRNEIWSYGLRNPWRFSFDRADGYLWIGDVGQARLEEVDRHGTGRNVNWGWDEMEGTECYEPSTGCNTAGKYLPIDEYGHVDAGYGSRCSITGGYVYRGPVPDLVGRYIFADWCSGEIFSLAFVNKTWTRTLLRDTTINPTSFGEGADGELYMVGSGNLYRVGR